MVSLRRVLGRLAVLGVVALLALGAVAGVAAATLEQPQVRSVDAEWGEVDRETTGIRTTVVVDNPNSVGTPGVARVDYTARLNDVVVAEGTAAGVGFDPGRNVITIPAEMDNDAIARWWVTHVNRGERSTLTVTAGVGGPVGPAARFRVSEDTVETDLLAPMRTDEPRTISVRGREFLRLEEQSAAWGEATAERTPLTFSATVTNRHDHALTLDGVGYVVRMNGVTVGEGNATEGVAVAPGETGSIEVTAALSTPRLADWWATHVRNDETTTMTVEMYGLVERDGELERVPLRIFEQRLAFETALLDGGATSVRPLATNGSADGPDYDEPTVQSVDRRWGAVGDETTEVRTEVTVHNPNEGDVNDLLGVVVGQTVAINDVTVADGETEFGTLNAGTNQLDARVEMDNARVPSWWAAHVNRGERSTVRIEPLVAADLGFTRFDVATEPRENAVETDLLAGFESDESRSYEIEGRTVAVVHGTRAEWGEADEQETPVTVSVTIENRESVPLTVRDLDYRIAMNDVVVGDDTAPESHTVAPGATTTVAFTLVIDSQRMDEWWVAHVRNDETTRLDTDATVTVESAGQSADVEVSGLTGTGTVETDFLGREE